MGSESSECFVCFRTILLSGVREKEFGDIESCVLPVVIDQIRTQFRKRDKLTVNQRKGIRLSCLSGIKDYHIGYLYCVACGFGKISFLLRNGHKK